MSKINVDSSNVEDLKINSSYDKKEEKIEEEEEEENEYNLIADEPNQTNEEAKESNIINNNNQKQNETNNSKFKNILGNISEYEDSDKSLHSLVVSNISLNSFIEESGLNIYNSIVQDLETQEILNEINKKINEGIIPFFIKLDGHSPLFIYAKNDIEFIVVIKESQDKLKIDDNYVFILNNKVIEYDNYNKKIGELGIEPLNIIKAQYANF
jgi:hypothetical protein